MKHFCFVDGVSVCAKEIRFHGTAESTEWDAERMVRHEGI